MTKQQLNVLAGLLGLSEPDRAAAYEAIFKGSAGSVVTAGLVDRLRAADASIRGAYVVHGPMEFRIVVGHRDTHRAPGAIELKVGDTIRLTAQSTERWVPVQVTALPASSADYYSGVIVEQLAAASRFQAGNGVRFSEDQVMVETPRAASSRARRFGGFR